MMASESGLITGKDRLSSASSGTGFVAFIMSHLCCIADAVPDTSCQGGDTHILSILFIDFVTRVTLKSGKSCLVQM